MRILVAGGAGFIGSNFIRYILGAHGDWSVVNVDKLTYAGNLANLADMAGEPRYRFHRADICDAAEVARIFAEEKPGAVVNFAAETHVDRSIDDPALFLRTNILGTQVLLDAARKAKVARYLQISTDEVYGSLGATGHFSEESPLEAQLSLRRQQDVGGPAGAGVREDVRPAGARHPLLEQLRPVPVSREAHPVLRDAAARGEAGAGVRRRDERARLDPRGGPFAGGGRGAAARAPRRDLQRGRGKRADEHRDHEAADRRDGEGRDGR